MLQAALCKVPPEKIHCPSLRLENLGLLESSSQFLVSKFPLHWPRAQLDDDFSFNPAVSWVGWGVQRHLHPIQNSSIVHLATLLEGSPPPCIHITPETEDDGLLHPTRGRQSSEPHSSSLRKNCRRRYAAGCLSMPLSSLQSHGRHLR